MMDEEEEEEEAERKVGMQCDNTASQMEGGGGRVYIQMHTYTHTANPAIPSSDVRRDQLCDMITDGLLNKLYESRWPH